MRPNPSGPLGDQATLSDVMTPGTALPASLTILTAVKVPSAALTVTRSSGATFVASAAGVKVTRAGAATGAAPSKGWASERSTGVCTAVSSAATAMLAITAPRAVLVQRPRVITYPFARNTYVDT